MEKKLLNPVPTPDSPEELAAFIVDLYNEYGGQQYDIGEVITQKQHACQAAGHAARATNNNDECIVAAFLHDIGHILPLKGIVIDAQAMGTLGIEDHEKIGHDWLLSKGFPESVAFLVKGHVSAKCYLTDWRL